MWQRSVQSFYSASSNYTQLVCFVVHSSSVFNEGVNVYAFPVDLNLSAPVDVITWTNFGDLFGLLGGLERPSILQTANPHLNR